MGTRANIECWHSSKLTHQYEASQQSACGSMSTRKRHCLFHLQQHNTHECNDANKMMPHQNSHQKPNLLGGLVGDQIARPQSFTGICNFPMRRQIRYHGELGRRQMLRFCLATTLRFCDPIPDLCRNDATVRSAAAVDLFGAAGMGAHARTPSSSDAPRGPLLETPIPCDGSRASRRTDVHATDGHWRISLCSKRRHVA